MPLPLLLIGAAVAAAGVGAKKRMMVIKIKVSLMILLKGQKISLKNIKKLLMIEILKQVNHWRPLVS